MGGVAMQIDASESKSKQKHTQHLKTLFNVHTYIHTYTSMRLCTLLQIKCIKKVFGPIIEFIAENERKRMHGKRYH